MIHFSTQLLYIHEEEEGGEVDNLESGRETHFQYRGVSPHMMDSAEADSM